MINLDNILVKLVICFPITVLLQRFTNVPNRVLFSLIITLLFVLFINNAVKMNTIKKMIALICSLVLLGIVFYDYIITAEILINLNDIFYLPYWFLFLMYLALKRDVCISLLEKNTRLIHIVVVISNIIIVISCLIDRAYFENGRHRMASGAFLLLVELYYYIVKTGKRKELIYAILPIVAILGSTSRTYVAMLAGLVILVYYQLCRKKINFYLSILPLLFIGYLVVMNSSMGQRFTYRQVGNFDYLGSVTSGRTIFWQKDIDVFMESTLIAKLLGSGYNLIYYANKTVINLIYAHNDFINILVANGIFGLIIYIVSFVWFVKENLKKDKVGFWITLAIIFVFFTNAFLNGQYNYPAAVFSIPFLFASFGYNRNIYVKGSTKK